MSLPNPITRTQELLEKHNCPALLITDIINVHWLSGFTGSAGVMIVTPKDAIFITDGRYIAQSVEEVKNCTIEIITAPKNELNYIADWCQKLNLKELYFETSISYEKLTNYKNAIPDIEFKPSKNEICNLRKIKNSEEVEKIQFACNLADSCLTHIKGLIKPGISEYELNLEIEFYLRKHGAKNAFDPIVAAGPNSAKPHARPSERKLENNEFLVIDFGAFINGYNSDMTRTFFLGEPNEEQRRMYNTVLKAQLAAIDGLVPGKSAVEVDKIARDVITEEGYGEYFSHGLGHGLGKDVHDPGSLSFRSNDIISVGQVWTVEPGIYIENNGGIRIEDDVLVLDNGTNILTHSKKDFESMIIH